MAVQQKHACLGRADSVNTAELRAFVLKLYLSHIQLVYGPQTNKGPGFVSMSFHFGAESTQPSEFYFFTLVCFIFPVFSDLNFLSAQGLHTWSNTHITSQADFYVSASRLLILNRSSTWQVMVDPEYDLPEPAWVMHM